MRAYSLLTLTILLVLAVAPAAWAQASSMYTVANVHVDATGASTTEAQNKAIAEGRPKAWETLYRRLTRQQDWSRQPLLDEAGLLRLSRGFTIANERRSTTRYVADINYNFNPEAVERVLRDASIAFTQTQARRILVVPMAPTFSQNAWTAALASPRFANSAVPFSVPSGDAIDMASLARLTFDSAAWSDVEPIASRARASEAVLVQAVRTGNRMVVNLRRLSPGLPSSRTSLDVPFIQSVESSYPSAADAAVSAIEEMWKTRAAIDVSRTGRLNADVRISSLAQWSAIQSQLAAAPNVTNVTLVAMTTNLARISISYLGTTEQLRDALAPAGFTLSGSGQNWIIAGAGR